MVSGQIFQESQHFITSCGADRELLRSSLAVRRSIGRKVGDHPASAQCWLTQNLTAVKRFSRDECKRRSSTRPRVTLCGTPQLETLSHIPTFIKSPASASLAESFVMNFFFFKYIFSCKQQKTPFRHFTRPFIRTQEKELIDFEVKRWHLLLFKTRTLDTLIRHAFSSATSVLQMKTSCCQMRNAK